MYAIFYHTSCCRKNLFHRDHRLRSCCRATWLLLYLPCCMTPRDGDVTSAMWSSSHRKSLRQVTRLRQSSWVYLRFLRYLLPEKWPEKFFTLSKIHHVLIDNRKIGQAQTTCLAKSVSECRVNILRCNSCNWIRIGCVKCIQAIPLGK